MEIVEKFQLSTETKSIKDLFKTYTRVPTTNSTQRYVILQCKNYLCVFDFDKVFCNKMLLCGRNVQKRRHRHE